MRTEQVSLVIPAPLAPWRHGGSCCARAARCGLVLAIVLALAGCQSTAWVKLRKTPQNPLTDQLDLLSRRGPRPTPRTEQIVRRYDLARELAGDPRTVLVRLREYNQQEPSTEKLHAIAELAYIGAKKNEAGDPNRALELYGAAVMHAYQYLFADRYGQWRNPYDPEFRGACDVYNAALEGALRQVKKRGELVPGTTRTIRLADHTMELTICLQGTNWHNDDFEKFEFVSDYEITGLANQYHTYGLGVPLVAVCKAHGSANPAARYYPPGLAVPMTAFLRMMPEAHEGGTHHVAVLDLYDPLAATDIQIGPRRVPLETDLSTPLAFCLNQPALRDLDSPTRGLLHPDREKAKGLYMLEPYQPNKIPVLMVHGLWSSPITWMEMFNDLRSAPEIRDRYQFWFYLYPTGQPFWYSATQLRQDLAEMRQTLDPAGREPALDQMVLVGHSMGGLVAKLQVVDSGNAFWGIVSDRPFAEVKASEDLRTKLAGSFFFQPNPAVRRLVTIGTPHHGSSFANETARWLSSRLIKLPQMLVNDAQTLERDNPGLVRNRRLLEIPTSIDSLAPDSPILPVLLAAPRPPGVKVHNVIGKIEDDGFLAKLSSTPGDGVVALASARLDGVDSELVVNADHVNVHRHPRTVLEVRRILLEHAAELQWPAASPLEQPPWTATEPSHQLSRRR